MFLSTYRSGRLWLTTAILGVVISCGCTQKPASVTAGSGKAATGSKLSSEAGIDFRRVCVGYPLQTLDFAGTAAAALAGAKDTGDVFYGDPQDGLLKLFRRNALTMERSFIKEIPQFHDSSLAASSDGKALVYCRLRQLRDVISDPQITFPPEIAVTYHYDIEKAVETRTFDFTQPEFRRWRQNGVSPFISPDGKSVYCLAYDTEKLFLRQQTEEWMLRDGRQRDPGYKYQPGEKDADAQLLKDFINLPSTRKLLESSGVKLDKEQAVTPEIRAKIKEFNDANASPEMALLVWDAAGSRAVQIRAASGQALKYHFLAAVGNGIVIVGNQDMDGGAYGQTNFYRCHLESGELSFLGSFSGLSKLLKLNGAQDRLLACYSPAKLPEKTILPETRVLQLPLDGSASIEDTLPSDYLSIVDLDADGKLFVGQDITDYNLYRVDVASGQRMLINELLQPLTGVLMNSAGDSLICLDGGITYRVDLSAGQADKLVTADYFARYQSEITSFLQQVGFTIPASGLRRHWEERDGLGAHEVSLLISRETDTEAAMLLRYDIELERVVACWVPVPEKCPLTAAPDIQGKDFDYYDALDLAERLVDRAKWIPADRRRTYQPGPNPLYDQRSDSYVITFRKSYYTNEGKEEAFSDECSVRITGKSGRLAEMTLSPADEVQGQPLSIARERLDYIARNIEGQAFPDAAPVRVDTAGARLIVYTVRKSETVNDVLKGSRKYRLCWEVDTYLEPEGELIFTNVIDAETGEALGSLSYMAVDPTATTQEH